MITISELAVAGSALFASLGILVFIFTRDRRKHRILWVVMLWQSVTNAAMYSWFYFGDVPTADRVLPIRAGIFSYHLIIGIITITLAYLDVGRKHES